MFKCGLPVVVGFEIDKPIRKEISCYICVANCNYMMICSERLLLGFLSNCFEISPLHLFMVINSWLELWNLSEWWGYSLLTYLILNINIIRIQKFKCLWVNLHLLNYDSLCSNIGSNHLVPSNICTSQYHNTSKSPIWHPLIVNFNLKSSLNSLDLTKIIPKSTMVEYSRIMTEHT